MMFSMPFGLTRPSIAPNKSCDGYTRLRAETFPSKFPRTNVLEKPHYWCFRTASRQPYATPRQRTRVIDCNSVDKVLRPRNSPAQQRAISGWRNMLLGH